MKKAMTGINEVAKEIHSLKSVYNKVNGLTEFTASEMLIIRKEFFPECSLEYLFGDEADCCGKRLTPSSRKS